MDLTKQFFKLTQTQTELRVPEVSPVTRKAQNNVKASILTQ